MSLPGVSGSATNQTLHPDFVFDGLIMILYRSNNFILAVESAFNATANALSGAISFAAKSGTGDDALRGAGRSAVVEHMMQSTIAPDDDDRTAIDKRSRSGDGILIGGCTM
jgi:hypothetical protein